ncbi:MAG: bifunctional phosphoribosylaminoimidazolecarboxamide formyltransferase/IMP cyclohydrolase [Bacteroidia bacterium]
MKNIAIKSALISVYHKQGLDRLVNALLGQGTKFYSTGGTADYLRQLGADVYEVADLTGYPSILNGRVKTLHPKVHGGILARRGESGDVAELEKYEIPPIDLVVVDLYPFEATVASGALDDDIIEKIDIGGIALIRAAAKNFHDVTIVPSQQYYEKLAEMLETQAGTTTLEQRRYFSAAGFRVSSHYDTAIYQYMNPDKSGETALTELKISNLQPRTLRYGENPHQKGVFYGEFDALFTQHNGKEISYNNLVDIEAAVYLTAEFDQPFFSVIKHTNPCGAAVGSDVLDAWKRALAADPVSAFGGVLCTNRIIDEVTANEINQIFFEVIIAPDYTPKALEILCKKKNRIVLTQKQTISPLPVIKAVLNGFLVQQADTKNATAESLEVKTSRKPTATEITDILFGEKLVKHLKSNAIAIVKNKQLIGSGAGQTSRIDALKQSVQKAKQYQFEVTGSVLASDAFFPFSDSVEFAKNNGIEVVVQPGGSLKDGDSVQYCEENKMCLVFTGLRHFKH